MSESQTISESPALTSGGWKTGLNWICAILIAIVFLVAGLWKATDPIGAAVRLAQAKVPESLSIFAAVMFGIAETFTGVLLLIPHFRRLGSLFGSLLLISFMIFIGIHYRELVGAECSCFPWIKRAVGPQFFVGDGTMLLLAIGAGIGAKPVGRLRIAALILVVIAIFGAGSYGLAANRHTGTPAPESIAAADTGAPISLKQGKVFIFFFNPHCLHCLDAGQKLAALNWNSGVRMIGVPTESQKSALWFLGQAGLDTKVKLISNDVDKLKKVFPFDLPPAAVALEDGYQKAMLLQFEDQEPGATLRKIGFTQ